MNGSSVKSEECGGGSSSPGGSSRGGSPIGSDDLQNNDKKLKSGSPTSSPAPPPLLNYSSRLHPSSLLYQNTNPGPGYSPDQVAYLAAAAAAAAAEHSALYAATGGGLGEMKDGGIGQSGWGYPSMYHPYDPGFAAAAAAAAAAYPFNGYTVDVNGSRRKNATRETTSTLKAWLAEHKKNPYPTKGEKIMLAIITKMTLTQVSTWFANARRRLKKENKMTWEPRNRPDDDDDVDISDSEPEKKPSNETDSDRYGRSNSHAHGKSSPTGSSCSDGSKDGSTLPQNTKPRIWSLVDLAGSGSCTSNTSSHQNNNNSSPSNNNHHHHSTTPSSLHSSIHFGLGPHRHHHHHHSGSAFSPLRQSPHSDSMFRGLYSIPSHHPPQLYPHPTDNP